MHHRPTLSLDCDLPASTPRPGASSCGLLHSREPSVARSTLSTGSSSSSEPFSPPPTASASSSPASCPADPFASATDSPAGLPFHALPASPIAWTPEDFVLPSASEYLAPSHPRPPSARGCAPPAGGFFWRSWVGIGKGGEQDRAPLSRGDSATSCWPTPVVERWLAEDKGGRCYFDLDAKLLEYRQDQVAQQPEGEEAAAEETFSPIFCLEEHLASEGDADPAAPVSTELASAYDSATPTTPATLTASPCSPSPASMQPLIRVAGPPPSDDRPRPAAPSDQAADSDVDGPPLVSCGLEAGRAEEAGGDRVRGEGPVSGHGHGHGQGHGRSRSLSVVEILPDGKRVEWEVPLEE